MVANREDYNHLCESSKDCKCDYDQPEPEDASMSSGPQAETQ